MRSRLLAALGGGAAVLLAGGCGLPTTTTPDVGPADPSATATVLASADPPQTGNPTSSSTAEPPSPATPPSGTPGDPAVATRPGSFGKDKVLATLYPVSRTGTTATVNLYVAAQDPNGTFTVDDYLGDGNTETSSKDLFSVDGVRLVDPGAKKAYLPAVTADGQCVCSPDDNFGQLFNSVWVTVTFAAPPSQLTLINVTVPTFGTFNDVPVR